MFNYYAKEFENLALRILKLLRENSTDSEVLEHLCLRLQCYNETEINGQYELIEEKFMWNNMNIIDISRMGKMDNFITNPVLQSDLNSTYHGAFQTARLRGFRFFKFVISLLTFGAIAPFILRFQKQITRTHYFLQDMKIIKKKKDQCNGRYAKHSHFGHFRI